MQQYFSWDEISNEIQVEEDRNDLRQRSDESGFYFQELTMNGVAVLKTDRHWGLECWAENMDEAKFKFSAFDYFTEMQEEGDE
jgi:hypothetical protein